MCVARWLWSVSVEPRALSVPVPLPGLTWSISARDPSQAWARLGINGHFCREQLEVPEPLGGFMNIFTIKFKKSPHLSSPEDPRLAVVLFMSGLRGGVSCSTC